MPSGRRASRRRGGCVMLSDPKTQNINQMSNLTQSQLYNSMRPIDGDPPVTSMMRRISGMFDRYMARERKFAATVARKDRVTREANEQRARALLLSGYSRSEAAAELGMSETSLNRLLGTGANFRVRLTDKIREQVMDLRKRGFSQTEIAALVGVSPTTVVRVYRGGRR